MGPRFPEEPQLTEQDDALVFRSAGRRVEAAVNSQTPEVMKRALGEMGDKPVYGVFVSLKREGQLRSCCGVLGPTIPLYEAVDRAAERAAKDDPRFPPISADELDRLNMEVWLLWGVAPIEEKGEGRVDAVLVGKHGLIISQGHNRGLLLPSVAIEHNWDARQFLAQTCRKAGLPIDAWKDDATEVMTFDGRAIRGALREDAADEEPVEAEQESDCDAVRPAAVAGAFYPGSPMHLEAELNVLFPEPPKPQPWPAVMVPHAGWMYSGRLAAATLARVKMTETVVVLCPKHRAEGPDWSVAPHDVWELPGGNLHSDRELAMRLADGIDGLRASAAAHAEEHAIEVLLPMLARLSPGIRVVGISIGMSRIDELLRFGSQMAQVLDGLPSRPLLIISSDLNHFADEQTTRRLDQLALAAMESLDPALFHETVRSNRISMCGAAAAAIVMRTLKEWGVLKRTELVGHTTSAEVSGDTGRVVGYAGMLLGDLDE